MPNEIQRDASGRWLAGGPSPNPAGRPTLKKEKEYAAAIQSAVSPEELQQAARRVLEVVLQTGSIRGFAVLADRLAGKVREPEEDSNERHIQHLLAILKPKPKAPAIEGEADPV